MTCKCPRVNGVKTCGWRLMGSTVQEDSNVIQNIQCSTTAAAPVTAGPTTTTTVTTTECSGFFYLR